MMKCLSIQQPWSWLITNPDILTACNIPIKNIENRSWATDWRGDLLLHAGVTVDGDLFTKGQLDYEYWEYKFGRAGTMLYAAMPHRKEDYQRGAIVGRATLNDVVTGSESPWFNGPYGFVLENAMPIAPIAYKGALKIFDVPASLLKEVPKC
jgi:hypothetical protein